MQILRTALCAGAGALMLSGVFNIASAASQHSHLMTLWLPGGAIEQIRYSGDVAPAVAVGPAAMPFRFGWPVAFYTPDSPFAELDRISAAMNRHMALMLRNADALARDPGLLDVRTGNLPPGSTSYSFVSAVSGNTICARSVKILSRGTGEKPQVISRSYGNCGSTPSGVSNAHQVAPAERPSGVQEIRYMPRAPDSAADLREAGAVPF